MCLLLACQTCRPRPLALFHCRLSTPTSHSLLASTSRRWEGRTTQPTWTMQKASSGSVHADCLCWGKRTKPYDYPIPFVCRSVKSSVEMKDYDRARIYVDNQFQAEDSFTVRSTRTSSQPEQFTPVSTRWSPVLGGAAET